MVLQDPLIMLYRNIVLTHWTFTPVIIPDALFFMMLPYNSVFFVHHGEKG